MSISLGNVVVLIDCCAFSWLFRLLDMASKIRRSLAEWSFLTAAPALWGTRTWAWGRGGIFHYSDDYLTYPKTTA